MGKYDLTENDIQENVNRFLTYIYGTSVSSKNPEVSFIVAGPGAGKSGVEMFLKNQFKERGEKATVVGSDKIAEFHPHYEEIVAELLPAECYCETRRFVRPATPMIYKELKKHKINILNEKVFNKGNSDIEFVKSFKEAGYRVSINIIATHILISKLSCYEREARMLESGDTPRGIGKKHHEKMYNAFVEEIRQLENQNLCDEINVYTRGESINRPQLVYQLGSTRYQNFEEALYTEREKQRKELLSNPADYLTRIQKVKESIQLNGMNPVLTENSINGLQELQEDFIKELNNEIVR